MARRKFIIHKNVSIKLPNDRISKITFIEHPGAVVVAPLLDNETIVMMKQFRPVLKKYIYELCAGTIDPHESPLSTAKRELIEETGYRSKKMSKLGKIYPVPGYSTEIIHIFKAEELTLGPAQPEAYEVISLIPMSKMKVLKLLDQGKIMDAKTICALSFLGWIK